MSWWVYVQSAKAVAHRKDPQANCDVECYCFDGEVFERNVTYNLGNMFRAALGRSLGEFDCVPAVEACGVIREGVADMERQHYILGEPAGLRVAGESEASRSGTARELLDRRRGPASFVKQLQKGER